MITWIQKYFQKHFRLVFAAILVAIGLPMIFVYSQSSSGLSQAGRRVLERPFFGVNLGNEEQLRRAMSDGNLSANLGPDFAMFWGREGMEKYSLMRVAGLAIADELHVPAPTADQVSHFVTTLRAFKDESGNFDRARYTSFEDSLKTGTGVKVADVNRVLRDDTRLEQVGKLVGGPGYVLAHDVEQQLIRADSSWTAQTATLDYATFNPAIPVTDEVLKKFHEENGFRYDVPARPRLSYVEFKAADFVPPTSPTEAELRAYYTNNISSFPVPTDTEKKDPAATAAPVDNFPKVRAQVEAQMKNSVAARYAAKAANDLTIALYDNKLKANSPELTAFLAAQRRPAVAIPPFAPDTPPAGLEWLGNYAEPISRLTSDRFFSDPLPTGSSYVVLLWNDSLPAYKPAFTEVHDRVAADYKEDEKRKLFLARGQALHAQLQAAAKNGPAAFASAAAAEKLAVASFANFTLRTPPKDFPGSGLSALPDLNVGEVSVMTPTADKGIFVYVQEKKLPDLTPANPRYVELQKQLMQFTAGFSTSTYLADLVDKELKKIEPAAR